MKIRLSRWPAAIAAIAVVTALTAAHDPGVGTYAANSYAPANVPECYGNTGFCQVAVQGFGDRANTWAWSMALYKNRLYVGTNRNQRCVEDGSMHLVLPKLFRYPPRDPDLSCPGSPNDPNGQPQVSDLPPTLGAQIWSVDPSSTAALTQSNWTPVYQSPITVPMTVEGTQTWGPRDMGFRGMSVYDDGDSNGPALYVSGIGIKPIAGAGGGTLPPPSLLRTTDGVHFTAVPADPGTTMGDINTLPTLPSYSNLQSGGCCMRGQTAYGGRFFVIIGEYQGAGAVFSSATPQQGDNTFQQITPPNMQVFEMAAFNNALYLGVQSNAKGYQVLKTTCVAPPPGQQYCPASSFTTVVPTGGGLGANGNFSVTSMYVYTDTTGTPYLYVGTDGKPNNTPAEIVRIHQDDTWDLVVGTARSVNGVMKTPLSSLPSGFGWPLNQHMWRMGEYNGALYIGTMNFATLYKDRPVGPKLQPFMGFNLWKSADGVTFAPVTLNGFGDPYSFGLRSIVGTPYGLFVASANYWYGLRVWELKAGTGPSVAPATNLKLTMGPFGGRRLAWTGSSNATTYHIYRATATMQGLPGASTLDQAIDGSWASPHPQLRTWVPGQYMQIGTTSKLSFTDGSLLLSKRALYYVVAEDANGNLSEPSNAAAVWPAS